MDTAAELFLGAQVRFLMTVNGGGRPPDKDLFAEMARFVEELTRAGVLLATGGLDRGTHVTASGGNVRFPDGPFTESKEVIVSFALIKVRSAEEPLELACANTGASSRAARHRVSLARPGLLLWPRWPSRCSVLVTKHEHGMAATGIKTTGRARQIRGLGQAQGGCGGLGRP
jgi:hypothetical protein